MKLLLKKLPFIALTILLLFSGCAQQPSMSPITTLSSLSPSSTYPISSSSISIGPKIGDSFDGTVIDTVKWVDKSSKGGQVTQDGRLILSTKDSINNSVAKLLTLSQWVGDFDVQIDYSWGTGWTDLNDNPVGMGIFVDDSHWASVQVGIQNGNNYIDVRTSLPGAEKLPGISEGYPGSFGGIRGKFRIVRDGSLVTFKYYRNDAWVEINTQVNWGMPVSLYVFCQSTRPSKTFTTYFDNFIINSCTNPSTPFINTSLLPKADIIKVPVPASQLPPVKLGTNGFIVNDKPFRFIGANSPNMTGAYLNYGLSIDDAIFEASQNGISVIRVFLWAGNGPWGGGPLADIDAVLDSAARHGVYVIATLVDMFPISFLTKEENFSFYKYEDLASQSALESYKSVVKTLLVRKNSINGKIYKDDTTIMAWDVANEPALFWFDAATIHNWLSQATTYIKSIDPNHLVTFGIQMGEADIFSQDKAYYEALNVQGLDFFSYHVGATAGYSAPPPGNSDQYLNHIITRAQTLLAMGKPVVLEEFYFISYRDLVENLGRVPNDIELQNWLAVYKAQMDAAFSSGASGAMFWGWGVPDSKFVPQYWHNEEHDMTETEFCNMIKNYVMPVSTTK